MTYRLFTPIMVALVMLAAARALAAPQADVAGINGAPCGYMTIGDAITAAVDGDTIFVAPGFYNEVLGTIGKDLHILAATSDCTAAVPDANNNQYVIDGGGAAAFHGGIANIAANHTVTFTRMTLQNADAIRGGIVAIEGGASATLEVVDLGGGHADDVGGILYVAPGASLSITGPSFIFLGDAGNAGGGLAIAGYAELTDARIRGNVALNGGGVALTGDGQLVVNGTWIGTNSFPNSATAGGGVHLSGVSRLEMHGVSMVRSNQATAGDGGGIYADGAVTLELYDTSRIYANEATGDGGGIYAANGAGISLYDWSEIGFMDPLLGNHATNGGGIFIDGAQTVNFYDQTAILNNTAISGGGIFVDGGTSVQLSGATVSANEATIGGGGVAVVDGDVQLQDALLLGNKASFGGGILLAGPLQNSLTVTNTQIFSNTAANHGGGVYAENGHLFFINTLVAGNHAAGLGGGLFLAGGAGYITDFVPSCRSALLPAEQYCSELRNNSAVVAGGAVYTEMGADFSIDNTAIFSNSAPLGSGVASAGIGDVVNITNSLLAHNAGKTVYVGAAAFLDLVQSTLAANEWAVDIDDNGADIDFRNNVIWDNDFGVESDAPVGVACSFSQNGVGGDMIDPLFQSTGRGDFRLWYDSPAVDACAVGVHRDLDGAPRPQGADYDSGAFETPPVLSVAAAEVLEGDTGTTPLTFTVSLSHAAVVTATVDYATSNLTAGAGVDYEPLSGTLNLLPGEVSATITVLVIGDEVDEADEQLLLTLSNPSGATLLPGGEQALGTLVDDDDGEGEEEEGAALFLPVLFR